MSKVVIAKHRDHNGRNDGDVDDDVDVSRSDEDMITMSYHIERSQH